MYFFGYILRVKLEIYFLISEIIHLDIWNTFFYKTRFIRCTSGGNVSNIF